MPSLNVSRPKKVEHASDEHRTTASSRRNAWESALVKACGNQMVVATMMFSDVHTQYLQRAINTVMKASLAWHENQAWFLRSCEKSEIWLAERLNGKFMECLIATVKPVTQQAACAHIGFQIPKQLIPGHSDKEFDEVELPLRMSWQRRLPMCLCFSVEACWSGSSRCWHAAVQEVC